MKNVDKIKTIKMSSTIDYDELMRRRGNYMSDQRFRNILVAIGPKCYIESEATHQGGDVVKIIRDRYGIPACFKVKYEKRDDNGDVVSGYDYIPATEISFYEPWSADNAVYDNMDVYCFDISLDECEPEESE